MLIRLRFFPMEQFLLVGLLIRRVGELTVTYRMQAMILGAALAVFASTANATLVLDFSVLNPIQTVGPTDAVTINGRITNDVISDENATASNYDGVQITEAINFPYTFGFGPSVVANFAGLDLAPGQSFDFVYGVFSPFMPPVPVGTYVGGPVQFFYHDAPMQFLASNVDSFTSKVVSVPEPATIALLGIAIAGLGFSRRRQ